MAWLIGLAGSGLIAGLAYWRRSLSGSGAAAAIIVGTLLYGLGSAAWFGTLIAFFVTSTLLSKWKRKAKAAAEGGYEKSGRRDAGQVLANGGIAALLCAAYALAGNAEWLWWAFIGVMATVNADTWATEIGGFSRTPPISIRTGKRVASGVSGGVTGLGLAATAAGAAFIGAAAWALAGWSVSVGGTVPGPAAGLAGAAGALAEAAPFTLAALAKLALVALIAGSAGALADSWLGATWQSMRRCTVCGREVERRQHCGRPAEPLRGLPWMNNDAVNLISSVVGGGVGVLLGVAIG
ncbi:DUF92 domain-containing protein [Paenibacillus chartarius]|uniref:DUF92 domain-containing protein n=1 Tax=Paenibacillus chartarius TaxID=747481 RepID=A0ABV6DUS8_9BACL